ncbi:Rho GTPase-activating protein 17 [Dissostichus eleginoides]|uniref:Rho GTPase-activating protein 17 n=1 Tax=Dissostichus eleginoides TaxID=100907 RepID=A0AAD9BCT4_DISEL|nr:Rho GTPase-activating protein 17 [Dissostichus eleginoides]
MKKQFNRMRQLANQTVGRNGIRLVAKGNEIQSLEIFDVLYLFDVPFFSIRETFGAVMCPSAFKVLLCAGNTHMSILKLMKRLPSEDIAASLQL